DGIPVRYDNMIFKRGVFVVSKCIGQMSNIFGATRIEDPLTLFTFFKIEEELDDSKVTSGYIFNITSGVVSWKSKKQTILSQSSMESEIIPLAVASDEASWLRCLLAKIPL
nr:Gag-Pol polyprotein [Tanacetum cinerariifolium]